MADDIKKTYEIFGDGTVDKIEADSGNVSASVIDNSAKDRRLRRMRRTTYQARLGRKMDNILQKVIDNNMRLSAHPTDMIRIEASRDSRSHDLISRTVTGVEVIPILMPNMEDIPLRHFIRDNTDTLIPSMFLIDRQEYFELYSPIEAELNEDDLLINILYDTSPSIDNAYVVVFQIKEVLGTFGYSSLIYKKLLCTFYDEALPKQIIDVIKSNIQKREILNW